MTSKVVVRSLYRSLLRAAAPFSHPSPSGAAHASLIHRTGIRHDWDKCLAIYAGRRRRARRGGAPVSAAEHGAGGDPLPSTSTDDDDDDGPVRENILPRSWARNLSRSYADLREEYEFRRDHFARYGNQWGDDDDDDEGDDDDDEVAISFVMGQSSSRYARDQSYSMDDDPKYILFRQLLCEWFVASSGGDLLNATEGDSKSWPMTWSSIQNRGYYQSGNVPQIPLTRFPSQILGDDEGGMSLRSMIRREFRAPTVEERLRGEAEEEAKSKDEAASASDAAGGVDQPSQTVDYPSSSYVETAVRIQTAFHTLAELNRKLALAERSGLPLPASNSPYSTEEAEPYLQKMEQRRLMQAAGGVSPLACSNENSAMIRSKKGESSEGGNVDNKTTEMSDNASDDSIRSNNNAPTPSLQCGNYLIAHPLSDGYFTKSVVVLLDVAEEVNNSTKTEEGGGGTYGLVVNKMAVRHDTIDPDELRRQECEILLRDWEERKKRKMEEEKDEHTAAAADADAMKQETAQESAVASSMPSDSTTRTSMARGPISLLQAINTEDLPKSFQMAFGDAPIREGECIC